MKHHNVFWTSCATHCIDLMFEAMGKRENVATVVKRARTITNYIYNHGWLLAKMREFCKGEIIRPATTRFATNYIALDSLLKKKAGLKQLFTSDDWANHNFSRSNASRMVESIVLDHAFWTQSEHVCQVFEPLYKVLRIVDTEVYPTMGAVYELMRVVKDELERKHGARWVIKIIEDRWYKTLYHDLHAAAYYLNPRYQYRLGVGDDGTLIRAVHNVYSKLDPASPAVGQFGNELTWFKDARRTFGEPTSIAARTTMSPTEWWIMYGTDAPTVRKLAIKVLSQTASSSACERNWSTFALIHTKQRNRLAHSRLEKLVYCYYNMKLQIRDKEAEIDHVDRGDPLDVFDIVGEEDDDTEGNQLYQWIRPLHLDDNEDNPTPRVAEEARNEGINVERVLEEEDVETTFDRPPRNNDEGVRKEKLSVLPKSLDHSEIRYETSCHVSYVKFLAATRDDKLCTQNIGVHVPGQDPTDDDIDNVADQRLESSMEIGAETLRDTNLIQEPFQIEGVSSIEIVIQSITIDLGNLPRYDDPVPTNDDGDVHIDDEKWDTE
ncbi:uncharacterized protein [Malus domestica]|uniref:uncharacterized protein n=1 Tax=Malus domestica TaxID=3750 RepID=UPI0039759F26